MLCARNLFILAGQQEVLMICMQPAGRAVPIIRWHFRFIAVVLATCAVALPADAQVSSNSNEFYETTKAVVGQWLLEKRSGGYNISDKERWPDREYVLRYCGTFSDLASIDLGDRPKEKSLMNLAAAVLYYAHIAENRLGYPKMAWEKTVQDFQSKTLERINKSGSVDDAKNEIEFTKQMVEVLRAYRKEHPELPSVSWNNVCGDVVEKYSVTFRTSPADGELFLIPTFYFELCKKTGVDPLRGDACRYWRQSADAKKEELIGEYYIKARWRNGSETPIKLYDIGYKSSGTTITIALP
jgi:hypothetical protein